MSSNVPTPDISGTRAQLLDSFQKRLAERIKESSNYIQSLPLEVKWSVEALKGLETKLDEFHAKRKCEATELEKKYHDLAKPLYERRNAIINGKEVPKFEEIEAGAVYSLEDDETHISPPEGKPLSAAAIPEFWLTALRNHIGLADLITDRDEAALKHLTDIRCEYWGDSPDGIPGFKLIFAFSPNKFFDNEILTKTYIHQYEGGPFGDFILDSAIGTEIKWKEDKDLTKEFEIKKQRNKNTKRTHLVRKARPTKSFFNFFTNEEEEKLELDYELGADFRDKIIPRAVDYFTGKAVEDDITDEDEDDFEDIDDEEDEDNDNDSDEDEEPPRRRKLPKGRRSGSEECKQQ